MYIDLLSDALTVNALGATEAEGASTDWTGGTSIASNKGNWSFDYYPPRV